jgi:intracellular sulfur oxidation DsrE/DsrF family protein
MKLTTSHRIIALVVSLFACAWLGTAQAAEHETKGPGLDDHAALAGLQEAKGIFLIDVNDPNKVAHVLKVVGLTRKGLEKQGVKPHLIVDFIGPAVAFLTKDRRGIGYMQERAVSALQHEIDELSHAGVGVEACGIAMRGMDVSPGDLIPSVKPVANGYISAIAYQAKGYSLVPVY